MARTLALTTPREHGEDVRRLQEAVNHRLNPRGFHGIAVDGVFGVETEHGVERAKYLMGFPLNLLHAGSGPNQVKWLEDPGARPDSYKRLAQKRWDKIEKDRQTAASHRSGPEKAIAYARKYVGTHEAGESNWGGQVETWLKAVDCGPAPWCGAFAHACLVAAGVRNLSWRMRYVPYIVDDAQHGRNGLLKLVTFEAARAGDLICFDWNRDGVEDHVAIYLGAGVTIEGNTTRDPSAPPERQSNGGEVCVRRRGTGSAALWAHVARPRYV